MSAGQLIKKLARWEHVDSDDSTCLKCGSEFEIREGGESTGFCDECAQTVLQDTLSEAREIVKSRNETSAGIKPSEWSFRAAEQLDGEGRLVHVANEVNRSQRITEAARIIENETCAGEWAGEVLKMLEWHDSTARRENFARCGCDWCKPMRVLLAKMEDGR